MWYIDFFFLFKKIFKRGFNPEKIKHWQMILNNRMVLKKMEIKLD